MIIDHKAFFYDIKNLLLSLSVRRVLNYINILYTYALSCITGKVYVSCLPFAFSVEVSSKCNLVCPQCMTGMGQVRRVKPYLPADIYQELLAQVYRYSFYMNLYFQGEPFLNPGIFDLISKAKDKNFYTVISTNGHYLDDHNNRKLIDSGLDRLLVSLDGLSAETYKYYRKGGDFNKVINGITNLAKYKRSMKSKHPFIVLQFLVHRENEHELKYIRGVAKQLGVDSVEIKSMQFYDSGSIEEFNPNNAKYSRYRRAPGGSWKVKGRRNKKCFRLWSQSVLTSDGDVVPCCFDKVPGYRAGNVYNRKVTEIWKGPQLAEIRKNVLKGGELPGLCRNCYG